MVKGSVTISIEDFQALMDSSANYVELKDKTMLAAKEMQVFLSFLCTRTDISKYIEEFNRQSQTSQIIIDDGKAQIKLKENNSKHK